MDLKYHKVVSIPVGQTMLEGELLIPLKAKEIIIFSHGSGSSRFSTRNQLVADYLHKKNFGTLLFDLLTREEDMYYRNRFDIELLTKRLAGAVKWLEKLPTAKGCRTGLFGASTGAAAALKVAAMLPGIAAVVSRGGRPDLAIDALDNVKAPTLFIVGSLDEDVLQLNKTAFGYLNCEKKLEVITGASHLFEEQGLMEKVARLAAQWFEKYLSPVEAS